MTPEEQVELVKRHYALNIAGDPEAAEQLLSDDFVITTPPYMPFGGTFRGKGAFRELIPLVAKTVGVSKLEFVATTVGDDFVIEVVDFILDGQYGPPLRVLEVNRIRDGLICEITPFYFDSAPWIAAGERRENASN
jgi:ketosteroid isomerase-like protein